MPAPKPKAKSKPKAQIETSEHLHRQIPVRIPRPDHLLVELPDRSLGHLVDECPPLRELPPRDPVAEEIAQLFRRHGRALLDDDGSQRALSPFVVRYADDRRFEYGGVGPPMVLPIHPRGPLP